MFANHPNLAATTELKDLLDAHFENNENPHVTIARIWAVVEGLDGGGPTKPPNRIACRKPHHC